MAETANAAATNMEMSLKDGVIVDISPTSLLQSKVMAGHMLAAIADDQCGAVGSQLPSTNLNNNNTNSNNNNNNQTTNNNNMSPTNLTTTTAKTFRCERCDNYETNSRASLLLHVVQCLSSPARLKMEDSDADNLIVTSVDGRHTPGKSINNNLLLDATTNGATSGNGVSCSSLNAANGGGSENASPSSSSPASRKVFECDVCNMKFSNGANMRRHKMRHTGVKPYECRVCQKRFFRKDHLAEHFTTHTKTLPYHCPICNRGFQRQIAMRAHFQNEHVGQHDLVKTCPLCSYRAGSMKSLRIHFFNRHGIDLDNPGPGGTSSLLLALESQANQMAAAAAVASLVPSINTTTSSMSMPPSTVNTSSTLSNASSNNMASHQSDSGESLRSMDNGTPPMHYLTPHVEISTLSENGTDIFNVNSSKSLSSIGGASSGGGGGDNDCAESKSSVLAATPSEPSSQESLMDCSTKTLPSSTSNICLQSATTTGHLLETHITPSISLIPIKQEPQMDDFCSESNKQADQKKDDGNDSDYSSSNNNSNNNNRLSTLIKVSPLKSLLREDLKRRICAKANNRITRNAAANENNNVLQAKPNLSNTSNSTVGCSSTPICNGTITSTGQEAESPPINRKLILTCLFCGIEFPDETLYFLHKGCHCESNPWKCNICGEQCNNVYEFNSHLLSKSHQ